MDTSEYLPMFLAECREHLQELNTAVVRLEDAPDDRAILDEIFRAAHSLKGMSATMGFDGVARLTHQMEDVFELLRQRQAELPASVVDVLLECLDALEEAIDAIETSGAEAIEPDALISRLAALVRDDDVEDPLGGPDVAPPAPAVVPELADGERVVHLEVTLGDTAMMPSVRAFMVLSAVAEHGTVVSSRPSEDEVDGFTGKVIEVALVSGAPDESLIDAARSIDDVATVRIVAAADRPEDDDTEVSIVERPGPSAVDSAPEVAADGAVPKGEGKRKATTVRVDAERLDQLMHYMGELVVQRTHVEALAADGDIAGVIHSKDVMTYLLNPEAFRMEKILRRPVYVVDTARLEDVLRKMQTEKFHFGFVVDEHGGVEGIITLEDLLEEIVGEIADEYDEETEEQIHEQKDGSYLLDGGLAVRDLNRRLGLNVPLSEGYTTIAGFLMAEAGQVLSEGETVQFNGHTFRIAEVDRRRITKVKMEKTEPTES